VPFELLELAEAVFPPVAAAEPERFAPTTRGAASDYIFNASRSDVHANFKYKCANYSCAGRECFEASSRLA
jgi:hypothetical protein